MRELYRSSSFNFPYLKIPKHTFNDCLFFINPNFYKVINLMFIAISI